MAWIYHPTELWVPPMFEIDTVWKGIDGNSGQYLYRMRESVMKFFITSGFLGYKLSVNGETLEPAYDVIGGHGYWESSNYIVTYNRLLLEKADFTAGYTPVAWYNTETQAYEGDAWWSGNIPTKQYPTSTFTPRGTATGNVSVGWYMPRWEHVLDHSGNAVPSGNEQISPLGTYKDPAGVLEDLHFGILEENEYVLGDGTENVLIGEVAIWR